MIYVFVAVVALVMLLVVALCCLGSSEFERNRLRAAIRKHRDERGEAWADGVDEELYGMLPEGHTPSKWE